MDLFLDAQPLVFEKLGVEARLSEDPNDWPQQILDELYNQAPFASDYEPKIVLQHIDPDRRYGMGHIELVNKLAINPREDHTPPEMSGKQKVILPIVIKEGKLSPIDLLMNNGEVEPLTDERLRKALFRPSLFEAIKKRPGDMSIIEQLYPPNRQYGGARGPLVSDVGFGGGGETKTSSAETSKSRVDVSHWAKHYDVPESLLHSSTPVTAHGLYPHGGTAKDKADFIHDYVLASAQEHHHKNPERMKELSKHHFRFDVDKYHGLKKASAKPEFLLDAILPTIKAAHVKQLTDGLQSDPSYRAAMLSNETVVDCLAKLASREAAVDDLHGYLQKIAHSIPATVLQIQKTSSGFRVKTANADALAPAVQDVTRGEAVGALGNDLVSRVEQDGTTTITSQLAAKQTLEDVQIKIISEFGLYKVRRLNDNTEIVGWVFPKVMALTGEVLPLSVFSNGSEGAMQESIAGISVSKTTSIVSGDPKDIGCFYYASSGGAQALVPIKVNSGSSTPDGESYLCETILGETCTITKVEGLKEISIIGEGHYGIPAECGFAPLNDLVDLSTTPDDFLKVAEARALPHAVRVITDGSAFTFQGQEVNKLAGVMQANFLGMDDAVFLGTILGQDPEKFAEDLSGIRRHGNHEMWFSARPTTPLRDKYAESLKVAREFLDNFPDLRSDVAKCAAALEDPMAVDKILSVGFINPENVSIFSSYVPEFEAVIRKLAELLLAARLGLAVVEAGALQKAIVHLDKVVSGLRSLTGVPQA